MAKLVKRTVVEEFEDHTPEDVDEEIDEAEEETIEDDEEEKPARHKRRSASR